MLVSLPAFGTAVQRSALFTDPSGAEGVRCRTRSVQVPSISSHSWFHILSRGLNSLLQRSEQQDSQVQFTSLWGVCCSSCKHFCYLTHPDPHCHSPAKGLAPFCPCSSCLSPLDWPSSLVRQQSFSPQAFLCIPITPFLFSVLFLVMYLPAISSLNTRSLKKK